MCTSGSEQWGDKMIVTFVHISPFQDQLCLVPDSFPLNNASIRIKLAYY